MGLVFCAYIDFLRNGSVNTLACQSYGCYGKKLFNFNVDLQTHDFSRDQFSNSHQLEGPSLKALNITKITLSLVFRMLSQKVF